MKCISVKVVFEEEGKKKKKNGHQLLYGYTPYLHMDQSLALKELLQPITIISKDKPTFLSVWGGIYTPTQLFAVEGYKGASLSGTVSTLGELSQHECWEQIYICC